MKRFLFILPFMATTLFGATAKLQVDTKTHAMSVEDGSTIIDAKGITLTLGGFTIYDAAGVKTIVTGSTSGVMFGAAGNKIGFLGATPIVKPSATTDLRQALINLGLYTTGGASPLNLNGGALTGRLLDKGGQIFDVRAYGALMDGVNDDTSAGAAAVAAAVAAGGGVIFVPPGTFRGSITLTGSGAGLTLMGTGSASIIRPDLNTESAVVVDLSEPILTGPETGGTLFGQQPKICNLKISREVGTLPGGTIGIKALQYQYLVIEDVEIERQDLGLSAKNYGMLGIELQRTMIRNCVIGAWFADIPEVHIISGNFGKNGFEEIASTNFIVFEGATNDVRIIKTQFIPRTVPNSTVVFNWRNSLHAGVFHFIDINTEGAATIFKFDSTVTQVADLDITHSRLTTGTGGTFWNVVDKNVTGFGNLKIDNNQIGFTIACELGANPYPTTSTFTNNTVVQGALTFTGGNWNVVGNHFIDHPTFAGDFPSLNLIGNFGIADADITSTSTNITSAGNTGCMTRIPTSAPLSMSAATGERFYVYDGGVGGVRSGMGVDLFGYGLDFSLFYPTNDGASGSLTIGKKLTTTGQVTGTVKITPAQTTFFNGITPVHYADSAAPNDTVYFSTDAGKLVYKDSGGSVYPLY